MGRYRQQSIHTKHTFNETMGFVSYLETFTSLVNTKETKVRGNDQGGECYWSVVIVVSGMGVLWGRYRQMFSTALGPSVDASSG